MLRSRLDCRGARVSMALRCGRRRRRQGRGGIQNKHSTDVESPPLPLRVSMSIHPEGKSRSDLGSSAVSQSGPGGRAAGRAPGGARWCTARRTSGGGARARARGPRPSSISTYLRIFEAFTWVDSHSSPLHLNLRIFEAFTWDESSGVSGTQPQLCRLVVS